MFTFIENERILKKLRTFLSKVVLKSTIMLN